jgi:PAS domain S-box-containing protein
MTDRHAPDPDPQLQAISVAVLARAYEQSHEAILVTDAQNRIVAANGALCRLSGYSLDEILGKNPDILASRNPAADSSRHVETLQARDSGRAKSGPARTAPSRAG